MIDDLVYLRELSETEIKAILSSWSFNHLLDPNNKFKPDDVLTLKQVIANLIWDKYYEYKISSADIEIWKRYLKRVIQQTMLLEQYNLNLFLKLYMSENNLFFNKDEGYERRRLYEDDRTGTVEESSNSQMKGTGTVKDDHDGMQENRVNATPQNRTDDIDDYLTSYSKTNENSQDLRTRNTTDTTTHSNDRERNLKDKGSSVQTENKHSTTPQDMAKIFQEFTEFPNLYSRILSALKDCFITASVDY